jgi:hypothetical protein
MAKIDETGNVILASVGTSMFPIAQVKDPVDRKKLLEEKRKADAAFAELGRHKTSDWKKSCIVHNTDPARCGCPDSVSQQDVYRKEVVCQELPAIAKLAGEEPMEGPLTVVWTTKRVFGKYGPHWCFETEATEVRNANEVRILKTRL